MSKPALLLIGKPTDRIRERLESHFEVVPAEDGRVPDDREGDIEAVAINFGPCRAEFMDTMPKLKVVANYGVGYDNIDAAAAAEKGIIVTHTPNVLNDEVANTAIALILAIDRRIVAYDRYVRDGSWESKGAAPLTRGIADKVVGIVGLGRIGQTIAEKLEGAFGARIVYHTRNPKDVAYRHYPDLAEMARDADILVVVTPGGPATEKLVSREVMEALGPEGTLVNVARGTVVDEAAMIELLEAGKLGAAGLDVFEREPHVPDALKAMTDNVVLTPHIGSATRETRQAMGDLMVDNAIAVNKGEAPLTPVPECKHLSP